MEKIVQVIIKDALMLPSGFLAPAPYNCFIYARVPEDWTRGSELSEYHRRAFFARMYGENWENGNDDGSRYVVREFSSRVLADEEIAAKPWLSAVNDKEFHYWFYKTVGGKLENVEPSEL